MRPKPPRLGAAAWGAVLLAKIGAMRYTYGNQRTRLRERPRVPT